MRLLRFLLGVLFNECICSAVVDNSHSSFYFSLFIHNINYFRKEEKQLHVWQKKSKLRNNCVKKIHSVASRNVMKVLFRDFFFFLIMHCIACHNLMEKSFGWIVHVNSSSIAPGDSTYACERGVSECSWKAITPLLFLCHLQISSLPNLSPMQSFQNASRGLVMAHHV